MDKVAHQEKSQAAMSSIVWSALLTGIKISAGIVTGSIGIISEALHSALDLIAAGMTYVAVRVAAKPADAEHPFGHEKVENLSALAETVLLFATCAWIVWEAGERLLYGGEPLVLTWWAFAVVAISMLIDINRAAMLKRVAKKHKSQALEADALHFTTDIWSSGVVLLGLICVWCAEFFPVDSDLAECLKLADAIAALFVAGIVSSVAYDLAKRSIHALMDGGSNELRKSILELLGTEVSDYPVRRIRLRDTGARVFIELDVLAPAELHVCDAHGIADLFERLVKQHVPEADVIVHIEPNNEEPERMHYEELIHNLALRYHLRAHSIYEEKIDGENVYFIDVELPAEMSINKANEIVLPFREKVKNLLHAQDVVCRIEPDSRKTSNQYALPGADRAMLQQLICDSLTHHKEIKEVLETRVYDQVGLVVVCHCLLVKDVPLQESHLIAKRLECGIESVLPGAFIRVILYAPDNSTLEAPGSTPREADQ